MTDPSAPAVVLVTAPVGDAPDRLARALVERRLAACVNVVPGVQSHYRWQGAVHRDEEALMIVKIRAERFEEVRAAIVDLHPYDTPEVLLLAVDAADPRYLAWLLEQGSPGSQAP